MKKLFTRKKIYILLTAILLLIIVSFIYSKQVRTEKVSTFGKYSGYSENIYDGSKRTSDYMTMADGTQLAYDLFLPTDKGVPADKPLPTLFKYTPYDRAWTVFDKNGKNNLADLVDVPWYGDPLLRFHAAVAPNGNLMTAVSRTEWLGDMLKSGYAVIVIDRPGTGASFGVLNGNSDIAAKETDELLNWIAAQSWCNGSIGMFGDSIQAQIQFRAASTGNPHLKAILPATTWMDNYSAFVYPGGIPDKALLKIYAKINTAFDVMATPVDKDKDGELLALARLERHSTSALAEAAATMIENIPYRDTISSDGQKVWIDDETLYPLLDRINRYGVPVYLINGWYDPYARDNIEIYNNLTVPKRLLIRPTDHAGIESPASDIDYGAEAHRWFDHWLKGIDNGIMDEPPIHYYLQGAEQGQEWQSAVEWPVKEQVLTHYYFGSGDTTGKLSVNNGTLNPMLPTGSPAFDAYTVDYSATTGSTPLWSALAMSRKYPNMRGHDAKALTYTTSPLESAAIITGHPIIHLWLTSQAADLDAFVYLEEVDASGNSTYITEGSLRASHRLVSPAPFDNFGLPWRNHFQTELQPIPAGEPVELVFDLRPTTWKFSPGKQIRITIAFADAGNFDTPVLVPAPTLTILRDAAHPSYVELPIIPAP